MKNYEKKIIFQKIKNKFRWQNWRKYSNYFSQQTRKEWAMYNFFSKHTCKLQTWRVIVICENSIKPGAAVLWYLNTKQQLESPDPGVIFYITDRWHDVALGSDFLVSYSYSTAKWKLPTAISVQTFQWSKPWMMSSKAYPFVHVQYSCMARWLV